MIILFDDKTFYIYRYTSNTAITKDFLRVNYCIVITSSLISESMNTSYLSMHELTIEIGG